MEKPTIGFETRRLIVRSAIEADKDSYMKLRIGDSSIRKIYESRPELIDEEWDNELNSPEDISIVAFLKDDGIFVACASFQNFKSEEIELSYNVVKEYRNIGIATELVEEMINVARSQLNAKRIIIRTEKDNEASIKIAEKFGGEITGSEDTAASRALKGLMNLIEEKPPRDEDWLTEKQEAVEIIEEGKDGVLVYQIDLYYNVKSEDIICTEQYSEI